jgi:protein involved in polysaccharide export with SLBB domain
VGDIEPSRFNQALDLVRIDSIVSVEIKTIESLIDVEASLSLKTLAYLLGTGLTLEVDSPHVSELALSASVEAVVSSDTNVSVV